MDMDSEDDQPYSSDEDFNCFDDSDNPDTDDQLQDSDSDSDDQLLEISHKKYYRILTEKEIQQSQEQDIALLSSALSIPGAAVCMVLHYYKWNVEKAQEAWFNDEDRVRKSVGLMEKPTVKLFGNDKELELVCGICFEIYVLDIRLESTVGFCGHHFCSVCLATYVQIAIKDGPGCLFLRCPDPSCVAVVGEDMVDLLVSDEYRNKYKGYLVRSYIEENQKTKWCPAPDCGCAIEYELGSEGYDVLCHCSCKFCWNCSEDAHSPVGCHTVAKWILKNSSESENVTWILANSKPCPKCNVPIEKDDGCMHMTCKKPCGYQFCWLCLGPWDTHSEWTGGYYECNIFEKAKQEGLVQDTEREMAKASLERYTHYYERWDANHKSREKARADLHELKTVQLQKLEEKLCQTAGQLNFVTDAWVQIIECRRVLKWTYAYGYYLPEHQSTKTKLFEFLQGEAEAGLEKLHTCAEQELKIFLENDHTHEFNTDFRQKLCNLTSVTRNFFGNLVRALENGLSDVNCA